MATADSRPRPASWAAPWRPLDGRGQLARFASRASLPDIDLEQHDQAHHDPDVEGRAAVVASLFGQLDKKDWAYNVKPWHADRGQLIRDPISISRGSGTCLDLALLLCAMAKDANLRPYLALARSSSPAGVDHAFVVVDTATDALTLDAQKAWTALPEDYYDEAADGYWAQISVGADADFSLPDTWLPIDPTHACRRYSKNVDQAIRVASECFDSSSAYSTIELIDVVAAHASAFDELPANEEARRPVLYSTIPTLRDYVDVPSRRALLDGAHEAAGYLVIAGDPGSGKSTIAKEIASRAAGGSGWFLAADDPATLAVSLAEAAMTQLGMNPAGLEGNSIEPYAQAALETLRQAQSRWVVVLDNADLSPDSYARLPKPKANQLVIVTTTAAETWRTWADDRADARLKTLLPLTTQDVQGWDGYEGGDRVPATPLLLKLAACLRRQEVDFVDVTVDGMTSEALKGLSAESVDAVRRLVWLPPVSVSGHVVVRSNLQALTQLGALGLVEVTADDEVHMHRSIREVAARRIRSDVDDADAVADLLTDPECIRVFEAGATAEHLETVREALELGHLTDETRARCLHGLGACQERKHQKAPAALFEASLALLGDPDRITDPTLAAVYCGDLQGVARAVFRAGQDSEMAAVLPRLEPIADMVARFPDAVPVQVAASRAEAMVGLLRRGLATTTRFPDAGERRSEKLAALALIEHSANVRAGLVDPDSPDIDRSRFNIPGTLIGLAKESADPKEARRYLRRAGRIYKELLAIRARRYGSEQLEEVVTCRNGLAIVHYMTAVLDRSLQPDEALRHLHLAAKHSRRAMTTREALAAPARVSPDSIKSSALLGKVEFMTIDVANRLGIRPSDAVLDRVDADLHDELARVRRRPVRTPHRGELPPLGSKADVLGFVTAMLDSPELWQVVEAFDDAPMGLPARRRGLADMLLAGRFADAATSTPDLFTAQAGRALAGWARADRVSAEVPDGLRPRVDWLRGFAAERWDFRQGRERDFIPTNAEMIDDRTAAMVYALARAWGMLEPAPASGDFDQVVVLGGLMRANVNRPAAADEMVRNGSIRTPSVLGLAGERAMSAEEVALAARLHCGEATEDGALAWGLARAFGSDASMWEPAGADGLSRLAPRGIPEVLLAVAPKDPETGRPDTGTAFGWLRKHHGGLITENSRVLSVTTAIYWLDGHMRLLQQMPPGSELVTTGSAPRLADADDPRAQTYLSQHFLQELKSAVDALPGLLDWAAS